MTVVAEETVFGLESREARSLLRSGASDNAPVDQRAVPGSLWGIQAIPRSAGEVRRGGLAPIGSAARRHGYPRIAAARRYRWQFIHGHTRRRRCTPCAATGRLTEMVPLPNARE